MTKPRDPFELRLSDEQRRVLAVYLCDQITDGLGARAAHEQDVDYWHQLYEQARTRLGRMPWPDAADLTSYIAAEKTDALHARAMRTVWSEPVWTVEGWGDAADRAPFVEEFHAWKAEEERLQSVLDRWLLQALIEPRGLLEVSEGTEVRVSRKTIRAKVATDPETGGILYGEDMQPQLVTGPDGTFEEAGPDDIAAEQVIDSDERVRTGPVYRLLPYRDSLILPGHARDRDDIWGYAKRFWRPYRAVQDQADAGIYDAEAVERMTATQDREADPALRRASMDVASQDHGQAEKELWEILILLDLNDLFEARGVGRLRKGDGRRWYLATIHQPTQALLRVQHDDLERCRFVPMILFPRIDRATEGFSLIGHKLITSIEEHTSVRNLFCDRNAMQGKAPIKRLQGALWEPSEQPWGPGAVIDVRDMREIEPFVMPDTTAALSNHLAMVERNAERIAGINDIASGQVSAQTRTLGEVTMATEQSFVRMDLIVRRAQEALEELALIRHSIWQRVLAERPEGVKAPASLLRNLEGRGVSIDEAMPDGKLTARLLQGAFRFKPHGSVQTADPAKRRQDWVQFLQILPMVAQAYPLPSANPMLMARAIWRETLRVFNVENQQAFLGSPAQDQQQQALAQVLPMLQQAMQAQMGGPPGMPPGMPPMGGPPMGAPPPMPGGPQGLPPAA